MMNKLMIFLSALLLPLFIYGQREELEKGNRFLDQGEYEKAEVMYKRGMNKYPDEYSFKTQLGFTYIQQKKYEEAEEILLSVLENDPTDMAANWYAGVMYFYQEQNRKALPRFEKAILKLKPGMGQFASACWFIGRCYENMLHLEGITQKEADRMFEVYEAFVELQPESKEAREVKAFLEDAEKKRPPKEQNLWKEER